MNKVITVGREFGSGGRELGRRIAETLGIAYYDQEIIAEIARRTAFSEQYVQNVTEHRPLPLFPIHVGRRFYPTAAPVMQQNLTVYQEQVALLRELAGKSDCLIVGRCADHILRDWEPFRIFVYADMDSKLARCREKAPAQEHLSDRALERHILGIDKGRAQFYSFCANRPWSEKTNYDLCLNTSRVSIKTAAAAVAKMLE